MVRARAPRVVRAAERREDKLLSGQRQQQLLGGLDQGDRVGPVLRRVERGDLRASLHLDADLFGGEVDLRPPQRIELGRPDRGQAPRLEVRANDGAVTSRAWCSI